MNASLSIFLSCGNCHCSKSMFSQHIFHCSAREDFLLLWLNLLRFGAFKFVSYFFLLRRSQPTILSPKTQHRVMSRENKQKKLISCEKFLQVGWAPKKSRTWFEIFPEPHQKVVVVVRLGAFVKFLYRSLSRSHPRALPRRRCFMRAKRRSTGKIRLTPGCAREWEGVLALEKRFSWKIVNITLGAGSPPPTFPSTNQF